jgi:hypothetical protein
VKRSSKRFLAFVKQMSIRVVIKVDYGASPLHLERIMLLEKTMEWWAEVWNGVVDAVFAACLDFHRSFQELPP